VRHVDRGRVQILKKQGENGLLDLDAESTAFDNGIRLSLLIDCEGEKKGKCQRRFGIQRSSQGLNYRRPRPLRLPDSPAAARNRP
jgi:hypothetical protein